ncbi:MAG: 2,3-diaminopropionate biosynthesis protein SbnA [Acidobacteriota bacterium]|nr:2,3-diaminopropionate biosynthesis protein SbnA [Acidobacteriota bacterium]
MVSLKKSGILSIIGNTPLIKLDKISRQYQFNIFAKMESLNPGGSVKDRTSARILMDAFERGLIDEKTTVIESSSGNMAIGLAQVCKYLDLKLIVVVDRNINEQNLDILKTYGAEISLIENPKSQETLLEARLRRVNELLDVTPKGFWTNQYGNYENVRTHRETMAEISQTLNGDLDYIFVATSTCGTLMGCAEYVIENNLNTKVVAVDAKGSVLFGDEPQKRLIPGHGAGRKSQFLNENLIHKAVHISDLESVKGCRRLLDKEAILAGGSSGAIIAAIEKIKDEIPYQANVAAIICDRGERYLKTIYNDEWVRQNLGVNLSAKYKTPLKMVA